LKEKGGITLTLYPFLADKMDSGDSIPTTRYELIKFTEEIEKEYPGFKFDWDVINKMNTENLWFLEILSN